MQERSSHETEPRNEDIALLAHHFYVSEGSRDGNDIEHWLRARNHLTSARPSESKIQEDVNPKRNLSTKIGRVRGAPKHKGGGSK